ncbi:MAG: ATP-binding protein [Pseudomonadota bacterium]
MKRHGLSGKIGLYMAGVSIVGGLLSTIGAYYAYASVVTFYPSWAPTEDPWVWTSVDFAILGGILFAGLVVSSSVSALLARRLLAPLSALADTARQITRGDLSARASTSRIVVAETDQLIDDFNAMAARIEASAKELTLWNASIAHELRTPVTILIGQLSAASDGLLKLEPPLLASLLETAEGLARLIEDLRVVSLADSRQLVLRQEDCDLADVLERLRPLVEPTLIQAGFTARWRLQSAEVRCDPARLRQAALALIDNAKKHATPGPLDIITERVGSSVILQVKDIGPGLTPDLASKIFDPFYRAGPGREGSGLGLAVVRTIAEAHGGAASCRIAPDGGAEFSITLHAKSH